MLAVNVGRYQMKGGGQAREQATFAPPSGYNFPFRCRLESRAEGDAESTVRPG